jgi:hypothetical protein
LKDYFNWDLYKKLKTSYKPVDYREMIEEESGVELRGEQACVNGNCEL